MKIQFRKTALWACLAAMVVATIPASATMFTWSQTAGSNSNADATINYAEGQAPSTLNNSARAMMAAIAKFRDDLSGKLDTAGSSTAYTLTSNQVFTSLSDGIQAAFRLDETNGASPTLNVDSLGAKPLRLVSAVNLTGAELLAGAIYTATYDAGGDEWLIVGPVSANQVPPGATTAYAGATVPAGWLECDGTTGLNSVSDTTLAPLFTAIGTTYGGTGAADFDMPDCTGRVIAGKEASATRLTTAGSGIDGDTLGAAGGSQTHTLTEAQMPQHDHDAMTLNSGGNHDHNFPSGAFVGTDPSGGLTVGSGTGYTATASTDAFPSHSHSINHANEGSGAAHLNVQPTIVMLWIIKK